MDEKLKAYNLKAGNAWIERANEKSCILQIAVCVNSENGVPTIFFDEYEKTPDGVEHMIFLLENAVQMLNEQQGRFVK